MGRDAGMLLAFGDCERNQQGQTSKGSELKRDKQAVWMSPSSQ